MVALAVLMPIVSSVGGNAGTQTLAVAVRALASKELNAANAGRIIRREILVAILNGVSLAVVMGLATWGVYHNPRLALTVGLALVANIFTAGLGVGILAPLLLERLGRDPAVFVPDPGDLPDRFHGFFRGIVDRGPDPVVIGSDLAPSVPDAPSSVPKWIK